MEAKWFFEKFSAHGADFDIAALSFYPAWDDRLEFLKQNMADIVEHFEKDVLVAETSYPWRPLKDFEGKPMPWPMSRDGQEQFLRELSEAIRGVPGGRGMGFIWWYPEAIATPGHWVWRDGAEGVFDPAGAPLPALGAFADAVTEPAPPR